jgi:hypothetical protein
MSGPTAKCLVCGGSNLEPAKLQDAALSLKNAKFFSLGLTLRASVCLDCGHVELSVDVEKAVKAVRRIRRKASDPRRGFPIDPV